MIIFTVVVCVFERARFGKFVLELSKFCFSFLFFLDNVIAFHACSINHDLLKFYVERF